MRNHQPKYISITAILPLPNISPRVVDDEEARIQATHRLFVNLNLHHPYRLVLS